MVIIEIQQVARSGLMRQTLQVTVVMILFNLTKVKNVMEQPVAVLPAKKQELPLVSLLGEMFSEALPEVIRALAPEGNREAGENQQVLRQVRVQVRTGQTHLTGLTLLEEAARPLLQVPEVLLEVGLPQAGLQVLVVVGQVLLQVEKLKGAQGQKVTLMMSHPAVVHAGWFLMNDG